MLVPDQFRGLSGPSGRFMAIFTYFAHLHGPSSILPDYMHTTRIVFHPVCRYKRCLERVNITYHIRFGRSQFNPWYFLARIRVRISILVVQQLKAENRAMRANLRNRLIDAWMAENGHVELESSRGHAHACPRPVSCSARPIEPIYGDINLYRTFPQTII